jgi:hypothetical protein
VVAVIPNVVDSCTERDAVHTTYVTQKLRPLARSSKSRACEHNADTDDDVAVLIRIVPSQLLDEYDVPTLNCAAGAMLSDLGLPDMTVHFWCVLRASHLTSKPTSVQHIATSDVSDSVVCTLLCVSDVGRLSMSRSVDMRQHLNCKESTSQENVVYSCSVTYVDHQSTSIYLHCVCAGVDNTPSVSIYQPIKIPCPYNGDLELGDIHVYPRANRRTNSGVCKYRGAR